MIGKGIYYFWNPGTYFLVGKQCDNAASKIMEAGGKKYEVQWRPRASFDYAVNHFDTVERTFGK